MISDGPVLGVVAVVDDWVFVVAVFVDGAAGVVVVLPGVSLERSAGVLSEEEEGCCLGDEVDGGVVVVLLFAEVTPLTIAITRPVMMSPATMIATMSKRMRLVMKIVYFLTTRYVYSLIVQWFGRSCNE